MMNRENCDRPTIVIEAGQTERNYCRDLWSYRELLYFLAWRDILVRYKQTALGFGWAVIRPFLTMVVFTVVFGKFADLPSNGAPYAIMVFAALLPWQFFATALNDAGNSLITNSHLISKVYLPRLAVPLSAIAVSAVDFLASCLIMSFLMAWYGYMPSVRALSLPVFFLLALFLSAGLGMFLSALTVRYRDFRQIIPFVIQFGLFLSPVGFDSSVVPPQWRVVYSLNPMVGIIDGFRWALLGEGYSLDVVSLGLSFTGACVAVLLGIHYFRATEKTFADVI